MTDFDSVMRALSDGSRRRILITLLEEEQTRPYSGNGDEQTRDIQLNHVHLPLLEEQDLVSWEKETGTVKRGDNFQAVEPILTAFESRGKALPEGYHPEDDH